MVQDGLLSPVLCVCQRLSVDLMKYILSTDSSRSSGLMYLHIAGGLVVDVPVATDARAILVADSKPPTERIHKLMCKTSVQVIKKCVRPSIIIQTHTGVGTLVLQPQKHTHIVTSHQEASPSLLESRCPGKP
jgi:hypothetical protein